MRAARRQPGLSHICDSVAEPSSNRRRPSIINPALSSRGSSHNMSPQVILTFFFFFSSLPSPCIVFAAVDSSPRSVASSTRAAVREKPLICSRLPRSPSQRPWTEKSYSEQRQRRGAGGGGGVFLLFSSKLISAIKSELAA